MSDDPSSAMTRTAAVLQDLARAIDKALEVSAGRRMSFSLILWAQETSERCNYVSNCDRAEVQKCLEDLLESWKQNPAIIPGSHEVN